MPQPRRIRLGLESLEARDCPAIEFDISVHSGGTAYFDLPYDNVVITAVPAGDDVIEVGGGQWQYSSANPLATGSDTFSFDCDGDDGVVTVSFTNEAPSAGALEVYLHSGQSASINPRDSEWVSDPESDGLTISIQSQPLNGEVVYNESLNLLEYTPNPGYYETPTSEPEKFRYAVDDGHGGTASAWVTLHVLNQAPWTDNVSISIHGGSIGSEFLSAGDGDDDWLTIEVTQDPEFGTVQFDSEGWFFTYTPDGALLQADLFKFTVSDGVESVEGTCYVNPINEPPTANSASFETHNSVISDQLTAEDPEGDNPLTFSLASGPSLGSVDIHEDGTFDYTPFAGATGEDSFVFGVTDTLGAYAEGTISITLTNQAPWAEDATVDAIMGEPISFTISFGDEDGDDLDVTWDDPLDGESNVAGSLEYDPATHQFTYTPPEAPFTGEVTFHFTAADIYGTSATGTVSIDVAADRVSVTANSDATVEGGDAIEFTFTRHFTSGALLVHFDVSGTADMDDMVTKDFSPLGAGTGLTGRWIEIPDGEYSVSMLATPNQDNLMEGDESVAVTVQAGEGYEREQPLSASATIKDAVTLTGYSLLAMEGRGTSLSRIATFTDESGPDNLQNALAVIDWGDDSTSEAIFFQATDGSGETDVADTHIYATAGTYTITIDLYYEGELVGSTTSDAVITSFVATADTYYVAHDRTLTAGAGDWSERGGVLNNDLPDSSLLTLIDNTNPSHGTVQMNADGTFVYVPNTGYVGQDTFQYTASYGTTSSETVVTIYVDNTSSWALDDTFVGSFSEEFSYYDTIATEWTGSVLANDMDLEDQDILQVTEWTDGQFGEVTMNANGTFRYSPGAGFSGSDSFTYVVSDGVTSMTATVFLCSLPEGDAPLGQNSLGCDRLRSPSLRESQTVRQGLTKMPL